MSRDPDVSVVLTSHREGLLAAATLRSLDRAIAYAVTHGRLIEVLISLDNSDDLTKEVIKQWVDNKSDCVHVFVNEFGDPGLSRNQCIQNSRGKYIAILDSDDMIGSNWIELSIAAATSDPRNIVWHPEVNVVFGESDHIFCHVDMDDEDFDPLVLIAANYWTSLSFARREIFLQIPYPKSDLYRGVGHEDWGWNRLVIGCGYIHKIVKNTGHAIRRKPLSQVKMASATGALPLFTLHFRNQLEKRAALASARRSLGPLDAIASAK